MKSYELKTKKRQLTRNFDYVPGKIKTNMYQYMKENHDKVLFWIRKLAKTPTCQDKFRMLEENSHLNEEDLVQETYTRILKTFYDNEQRLSKCQNCPNQCKEFVNRTKKTNTEKCTKGRNCRPYMYYSYSEKEFNNYINRALKQNIDIKLKKLTNKNGERVITKLEEKIGSGDDSYELGSLLADLSGMKADIIKDLSENLLSKKIVFTNKLDNFELLSDPYEVSEEVLEVPNEHYDEQVELNKERRRSFYLRAGLPIPENLNPEPKTIRCTLGTPEIDIERELNSRFDFIHSYTETDEFWKRVLIKAQNDDMIRIGTEYSDKIKEELKNAYSVNLDWVITDDDIRNSFMEQGETEEAVRDAELCAKLDMIEFLPTHEELKSYSEEDQEAYRRYLEDWDNIYSIDMEYSPKTTDIKIVDANYKIIPLPLCTYAEISVRDFLEMCYDVKKQGSNFASKTSAKSDYVSSFKEIWIDFENRRYNIWENYQYNKKSLRLAIYHLIRKARKLEGKNIAPEMEEIRNLFAEEYAMEEKITSAFIKKVFNKIKEEAESLGYASFVDSKKITMPIARRVNLTKEERLKRAKEKYDHILELRSRVQDNNIHNVNTSLEDTLIPNLTPQELFSSILEKIPVQETIYRAEEVKVLCMEDLMENQRVLSI